MFGSAPFASTSFASKLSTGAVYYITALATSVSSSRLGKSASTVNTYVSNHVSSLKKTLTKSLSLASSSHSMKLVKKINTTKLVVDTHSVGLTKKVSGTKKGTSSHTSLISKAISLIKKGTSVSIGHLIKSVTHKSSTTSGHNAFLSISRLYHLILLATSTHSTNLVKSIQKRVGGSSSHTSSLLKFITKKMGGTSSHTSSLVKSTSIHEKTSSSHASSVLKQIKKRVIGTSSHIAYLKLSNLFFLTLTAVSSHSASIKKAITHKFPTTQSFSSSKLIKLVEGIRKTSSSHNTNLLKSITHKLVTSSSHVANLIIRNVHLLVLSTTSGHNTSLRAAISKKLTTTQSSSPKLVKHINDTIKVVSSSIGSIKKAITHKLSTISGHNAFLIIRNVHLLVLSTISGHNASIHSKIQKLTRVNSLTSPSLTKLVGSIKHVNSQHVITLVKSLTHKLATLNVSIAKLFKSNQQFLTIKATATSSVGVFKAIVHKAKTTSSSTSGLSKRVGLVKHVTNISNSLLTKALVIKHFVLSQVEVPRIFKEIKQTRLAQSSSISNITYVFGILSGWLRTDKIWLVSNGVSYVTNFYTQTSLTLTTYVKTLLTNKTEL